MNHLTTTKPAPDQGDVEPPFDGLTPMQSAFVRSYVRNGDGNAAQAARDAGYTEQSALKIGYQLVRRDDVLRSIQTETARALAATGPMALRTMSGLLSARSEFVRQNAAADIMDRLGMRPKDQLQVNAGGVVIDIKLTE